MKKMSNDLERKWSNFLTSLENNHCEEKNYFEAIKYVSDIDSKTIDDEEIREKINGYIETIVQFIGKHKNYYELSNVKGFKKNDGSIRGRDYYYYIADQQIKATVYYARYLNFIEGCEITAERDLDVRVRLQNICDEHGVQLDCSNKDNKVECICKSLVEHIETNDFPAMKTLEKEVLEQVDNQSGNFEDTDSQVSNLGDNGQLTLDELKSIRIELLRYGEEYKISNNIDYRLYMMLNNMMHEIRFWGAAYQYLWHWKSYKKTLYRSGLLEKKDAEKKQDKNDDIAVHKFMKDMFQECIDHMNSPSLSRHSFSENLLIDVYKYLILEKEEHNALIKIKDENGLCIVCKSIKNEKEVEFHIIKGASINSIFVDGSDQDFSTFIQNNKIPVDYGYTVEIYPQELQGETNDKGTIKGMRDTLLPLYFKSWGIDASLSRTKVADDKEVITYEDVKQFYLDAYETLGNLLIIPAAIDNIKNRGDANGFIANNAGIVSLDKFIAATKANRFHLYNKNELYMRTIDVKYNQKLRNAIGHNDVEYETSTQKIIYIPDPKKREKKLSEYLLEFEIEALSMFQAILVISEYLYRLRELELLAKGVVPLPVEFPIKERKKKKIYPNEKCPCGSGLKYKKCHGRL